jgi:hypothetical protein
MGGGVCAWNGCRLFGVCVITLFRQFCLVKLVELLPNSFWGEILAA